VGILGGGRKGLSLFQKMFMNVFSQQPLLREHLGSLTAKLNLSSGAVQKVHVVAVYVSLLAVSGKWTNFLVVGSLATAASRQHFARTSWFETSKNRI